MRFFDIQTILQPRPRSFPFSENYKKFESSILVTPFCDGPVTGSSNQLFTLSNLKLILHHTSDYKQKVFSNKESSKVNIHQRGVKLGRHKERFYFTV